MAKKTIKLDVNAYTIQSAPRASSVQLIAKDSEGKQTESIVVSSMDEKFITALKDKKTVTITIE